MNRSPLNLSYHPLHGFKLTVYTTFNRKSYDKVLLKKIYYEHIKEGVIENWTNSYPLNNKLKQACINYFDKNRLPYSKSIKYKDEIDFSVEIITDPLSGVYPPRIVYFMRLLSNKHRPIPIFTKNSLLMPSHVGSGIFRKFWGFFRYFKILSLGLNWSRNFPGYAVINNYTHLSVLKSVSAHEFGHLFGLDDAYAAWYRFYYAAPGTESFMMHFNRKVHSDEIAMVINAMLTNRMQFFPVKFSFKNFKQGFAKELAFYSDKIEKLFSDENS